MDANIKAGVERLIRQLAPELKGAEIDPESKFEDLGLDSLTQIDLMVAAEGEYGIAVPDEVIPRLIHVRDLVDFVESVRVG
jgi:acyl carrier protein